jgi:excisionase family DNA binding protein
MLTTAHTRSLLTVKEVASRLALHPQTVRTKIRRGELPAVQLGRKGTSIRVASDELDAFLYGLPEEPA